jgi:hypothetical protein
MTFLLDDKDRKRAAIEHWGLQHRRPRLILVTRYNFTSTNNGTEITDNYTITHRESNNQAAIAFLNDTYPYWRNPATYWD